MSLSKYIKMPSDKVFLSNKSYSDILFAKLCLKIKSNYGRYVVNKKNILDKINYKADIKTFKKRIDSLERGGYIKNYTNEIEIYYKNIEYGCKISKKTILKFVIIFISCNICSYCIVHWGRERI